ncbi:hypothetical protein FB451DRAFT_1165152 [Mycena latifolia]|nr:hypothetical protein FB451DRAFT_1165152 [Mycena latifolia]
MRPESSTNLQPTIIYSKFNTLKQQIPFESSFCSHLHPANPIASPTPARPHPGRIAGFKPTNSLDQRPPPTAALAFFELQQGRFVGLLAARALSECQVPILYIPFADRIFNLFTKVESGPTQKTPLRRLGLLIVTRIDLDVNLHDSMLRHTLTRQVTPDNGPSSDKICQPRLREKCLENMCSAYKIAQISRMNLNVLGFLEARV